MYISSYVFDPYAAILLGPFPYNLWLFDIIIS